MPSQNDNLGGRNGIRKVHARVYRRRSNRKLPSVCGYESEDALIRSSLNLKMESTVFRAADIFIAAVHRRDMVNVDWANAL